MSFNLNWFLGVLAIEFWLAPYILMFLPEIRAAWRARQRERAIRRYVAQYEAAYARTAGFRPYPSR